ncbi:MAG: hypothetical protein ACK4Z6_08160 [Candidatus Methylomirabilales bacterium]
MKRKAFVVAAIALFGWGLLAEALAQQTQMVTLIMDVGSGSSIGMGMGGSLSQGMMGQVQAFQHRVMSFEFPGIGTCFAMMAGGNPWTGAKGIVMGGTDGCQGVSGTVEVGPPVGQNQYPFTFEFHLP